jgi:hypothetical protein
VLVYAVRDLSLDGSHVGDIVDVLLSRAAAERFIEDVRGDDRALAAPLCIVEIELQAGDSAN